MEGVQCRALLGLNIAYARLRRLKEDVPVLPVYVCDAWLGNFGVVHKSLRQISHAEAAEQCFARREPFPVARRTHAVLSTRQVALHARAVGSVVDVTRRVTRVASARARPASAAVCLTIPRAGRPPAAAQAQGARVQAHLLPAARRGGRGQRPGDHGRGEHDGLHDRLEAQGAPPAARQRFEHVARGS